MATKGVKDGSKRGVTDKVMLEASDSVQASSAGTTAVSAFWLSALRASTASTGLADNTIQTIQETLLSSLSQQFVDNFEEELQELLTMDVASLEDRVASQMRRLKRDQRKTSKRQTLLQEEQDRLESFRPGRKANENHEAQELDEKLHPWAQAVLSTEPDARKTIPVHALQNLSRATSRLGSLEEGLDPYNPDDDEFLQGLLQRLEPKKKSRKKRKL